MVGITRSKVIFICFPRFLFLESNCLECSCLVWQRCCTCRCRAACEEKISKKIDYAIDSYPGHPADFFSKAMTYQNVMRNSIKKLSKPAAKQKIKDMVSLNPRRPRAKDSTGKYKTKTPGSGYIAIFCFKDVHFKSVRIYCARDSGKPFSKSWKHSKVFRGSVRATFGGFFAKNYINTQRKRTANIQSLGLARSVASTCCHSVKFVVDFFGYSRPFQNLCICCARVLDFITSDLREGFHINDAADCRHAATHRTLSLETLNLMCALTKLCSVRPMTRVRLMTTARLVTSAWGIPAAWFRTSAWSTTHVWFIAHEWWQA